jgi:hypothetical protein
MFEALREFSPIVRRRRALPLDAAIRPGGETEDGDAGRKHRRGRDQSNRKLVHVCFLVGPENHVAPASAIVIRRSLTGHESRRLALRGGMGMRANRRSLDLSFASPPAEIRRDTGEGWNVARPSIGGADREIRQKGPARRSTRREHERMS